MPFYIRKSVSAGPFRFNFSNSGVGVSVGVKGFRIGTGPRGHYVHAGRGGLYYRASLNPKGRPGGGGTPHLQPVPSQQPPGRQSYSEPGVQMFAVSSADVMAMQDERFSDLLAEVNAKQNTISKAKIFGLCGAGIIVLALISGGTNYLLALLILTGLSAAIGAWMDSYQRSAVLMYQLEDDTQQAYIAVTEAFDQLAACAGKWHIDAGGAVQDIHAWKRNAGASHLLARNATSFQYALPRSIKSNVTPPAMKVGKETIYFFPDVALVVESSKVGAVAYDALQVHWRDSNFIEDGGVPSDARVINYTWKHPNKSGGPDRRFRDNRQLPVCLYETIHLSSSNGLNEMVQVSRSGFAGSFAEGLRRLVATTGGSAGKLALPKL